MSNWNTSNNVKIDLVDEQDRVIGKTNLFQAIEKNLANVRVVKIFIENSEGLVWIPKISKNMEELFDVSVSQPVLSGDSYEESFFKLVSDVLNIDISGLTWEEAGCFTPFDGSKTDVFIQAYKINLVSEVIEKCASVFAEGAWYTPQQIFDQVFHQGEKSTNDLKILLFNVYAERINKITVLDLLDCDPEEEIFKFITDYAENRYRKVYVEDIRQMAENNLDTKIKKGVKKRLKGFPANAIIFPFLKKMSVDQILETRSEKNILSSVGYLPFKYWTKKDRDNWCNSIATKFGLEFRIYIYVRSFCCTYWKKTDYKACGDCFEKLELNDGTIVHRANHDEDIIKGISFKRKKEERGFSVDEITTVYIHDPEIFPVKIYYYSQDIYSVKGHGTTGTRERYIEEIRCKGNGHVESFKIK